ncbi:MAG TPA: ribonuclease HII [Actinomycetota bacterium]|nr:ribonuclease HII [Actinomycetota bacterium]
MAVRRLKPIDHYERQLRERGFRLLAGVDEAGRGALAGPLVAAAVILPEGFDPQGIEDSKLLTRKQREEAYRRVVDAAVAFAVCRATPGRIDRHGLHRTNVGLLRKALRTLQVPPEFVLCDGFPLKRLGYPCLSVRKGDVVTMSVAAASVLAKVTRDRIMDRYHRRFPHYGFDTNRGYGTSGHWDALWRFGPSPIHRRSFNHVLDPLSPQEYEALYGPRGRRPRRAASVTEEGS